MNILLKEKRDKIKMSNFNGDDMISEFEEEYTRPMPCSTLRKGGYVVMQKEHPCKIMDISTSKPGKHGSAKAHIIGIDIFNGKRYEEIFQTHSRVSVPEVKRSEHEVSFVNTDGYIHIFNDDMTIRSDLKWTDICQTPYEDIRAMVAEAEADTEMKTRVEALVISGMGKSVIKEVKKKKE